MMVYASQNLDVDDFNRTCAKLRLPYEDVIQVARTKSLTEQEQIEKLFKFWRQVKYVNSMHGVCVCFYSNHAKCFQQRAHGIRSTEQVYTCSRSGRFTEDYISYSSYENLCKGFEIVVNNAFHSDTKI